MENSKKAPWMKNTLESQLSIERDFKTNNSALTCDTRR